MFYKQTLVKLSAGQVIGKITKGWCKRGTIVIETKLRPGRKNMAFCFQCAVLVFSTYMGRDAKEEAFGKHRGNTDFEYFTDVSSFPTYFEDIEFASHFTSFSFAHSRNVVSNIDSKCSHSSASSFAPAF